MIDTRAQTGFNSNQDLIRESQSSIHSTIQTVNQQIDSEPHPYRVPVFKLEPLNIQFSGQQSKAAKSVRLVSCDFATNYYNVSPNNNCLRWLRKVNLSLNEHVIEKYPENINVVNPYFDGSYPNEEWHLCTLYINPSQYTGINAIIDEVNDKLNESFKSLFNISSFVERAYTGVQLNYNNYIFNPSGVIKLTDTLVNSSILSSDEAVPYIIDGEMVYTQNDVTSFATNGIVDVKNLDNATLTNTVILNPKFQQNEFTEYQSNDDWYVHTSTLSSIANSGTDNIAREIEVLKTDASVDLFVNASGKVSDSFDLSDLNSLKYHPVSINGTPIIINKAALKTFPDYIGLTSDTNRRKFSEDKYMYLIKERNGEGKYLNKDLRFDVDLSFEVKETDSGTYGVVSDGLIRPFSINCNINGDPTKCSPIDYKGRILNSSLLTNKEKVPVTKVYYDDNSHKSTKYPFYNITFDEEDNENYVIERYNDSESVIKVKTNNENVDLYVKIDGADVGINERYKYSYDIYSGEILSFELIPANDGGEQQNDGNDEGNEDNDGNGEGNDGESTSAETNSNSNVSLNASYELIGYCINKITNPDVSNTSIDNEVSITLIPNTDIVSKQYETRFEQLSEQPVNEIIANNQANLIITEKVNVTKSDKHGTNSSANSSLLLEYYFLKRISIDSNVSIYKNGTKTNELGKSIFYKVPIDDTSLKYAYILSTDSGSSSSSIDYYQIYVSNNRVCGETIFIDKNEETQLYTIYGVVVDKDSIIECDANGDIIKRWYIKDDGSNEIVNVWEINKANYNKLNECYANGDTERNYYRIIISEANTEYIDSLINTSSEEMLSGNNIEINNVIRKPVNNLLTETEYKNIFTPLDSDAFKFDSIYNTNVENMLYLPFGTLRKTGGLSMNYNIDDTTYSKEIDGSYIFNDIMNKDVKMLFDIDKIANETKTITSKITTTVYTPTYYALNVNVYGGKPYFVKNNYVKSGEIISDNQDSGNGGLLFGGLLGAGGDDNDGNDGNDGEQNGEGNDSATESQPEYIQIYTAAMNKSTFSEPRVVTIDNSSINEEISDSNTTSYINLFKLLQRYYILSTEYGDNRIPTNWNVEVDPTTLPLTFTAK